MKVKVYAKSAVDLTTKVGSYAYILDDMSAQRKHTEPFKTPVKTMTQADCMAYVNALHILSMTAAAPEVVSLEIITDSSKVGKLIEVFEFEKHCEDMSNYWRTKVKPLFINLQRIKIIKVDRKFLAGDRHGSDLMRCQVMADGDLHKQKELRK